LKDRTPTAWQALNKAIVACDRCPRLRDHCRTVATEKKRAYLDSTYWGQPVPNFGDPRARLLIVGLAPAAHGANRTGRMFTGDRSGEWLYRALHKAGFANQPHSSDRNDGLRLAGCAITAVCHCAPPGNKPAREEIATCAPWLDETVAALPAEVFLALGQIAWKAVLDNARREGWHKGPLPKFGHAATVRFENGSSLVGSYHPSQQNTFTGKLTEPMLDRVFKIAAGLLASTGGSHHDGKATRNRLRRASRTENRA
jgi:uracil-DNA glycosylase family 4